MKRALVSLFVALVVTILVFVVGSLGYLAWYDHTYDPCAIYRAEPKELPDGCSYLEEGLMLMLALPYIVSSALAVGIVTFFVRNKEKTEKRKTLVRPVG